MIFKATTTMEPTQRVKFLSCFTLKVNHMLAYLHQHIFSIFDFCNIGILLFTVEVFFILSYKLSSCPVSYIRHITERTNGTFAVASDAAHLSDLLQAHTVPPPELQHKGKNFNLNFEI